MKAAYMLFSSSLQNFMQNSTTTGEERDAAGHTDRGILLHSASLNTRTVRMQNLMSETTAIGQDTFSSSLLRNVFPGECLCVPFAIDMPCSPNHRSPPIRWPAQRMSGGPRRQRLLSVSAARRGKTSSSECSKESDKNKASERGRHNKGAHRHRESV